ncbi:TetR/AcrR family transcriptional regulator [Tropicibacter naphthalenivorans]|uniref:HTH-type transcriptional repressor KstR2 n=1 Tax=Tropicibacter naphthalenivorans TaxID=441103 RepID=A0A0P1FZS4_9RHOB|nr:TetR/AcrR family transcriptional regulator [Tropicibacter naphthalenivorans]CUH74781.1 HTH-type transcriptional repressor KstR2 [Tropicibacter naphthalenivorans]SMC48994.1 transcriptional regulator, TetR family [Tropicibacter naphthalenivorans]
MARGVAKDHDEKRQALRKGAASYFARNGFDRASMTGAAKECGVSKALLYHYHDSKEALLFDILDGHLSSLLAVVEEAAPAGLGALISVILEEYEDADAEHKLQLEALRSALPPEMQTPLIATQRRLVHLMAEAVRAEQPALEGDRLRAATMSVYGILNWFYMWHRPGRGLSREAYAELATQFVRGGLANL